MSHSFRILAKIQTVKNTFILIIAIFYFNNCFSQDTVGRKNRLTESVTERFYVLKSNPKIKEGPYFALYQHKTYIAAGKYKNGKKAGIWQFFNPKGKLVEKYNYDLKSLTYEARLDSTDDLRFLFDDTLKKTDQVTRPLKIGGCYYGFIPYVTLFKLPFDTFSVYTPYFKATIELLISPLGRLADYAVHLTSPFYDYDRTFTMDINLFSDEDRTFSPSTLNGKPVLSRIIIQCIVTEDGLDFY